MKHSWVKEGTQNIVKICANWTFDPQSWPWPLIYEQMFCTQHIISLWVTFLQSCIKIRWNNPELLSGQEIRTHERMDIQANPKVTTMSSSPAGLDKNGQNHSDLDLWPTDLEIWLETVFVRKMTKVTMTLTLDPLIKKSIGFYSSSWSIITPNLKLLVQAEAFQSYW